MPTRIRLHTLVELRRLRERQAAVRLQAARGARAAAENEQSRLDDLAHAARARWSAARQPAPTDAAGALAAERLRMRRAEESRAARAAADLHRATVTAAEKAEDEAGLAHRQRRQEREAVEELAARRERARRQVAERRAEEAASEAGRRDRT
jgi:hypothetical protein